MKARVGVEGMLGHIFNALSFLPFPFFNVYCNFLSLLSSRPELMSPYSCQEFFDFTWKTHIVAGGLIGALIAQS